MSYKTSGRWGRQSLVACIAAICLSISLGLSEETRAGETPDPHQLILSVQDSYLSVRGYTAKFIKQERINGTLNPRETIQMKFQKPFKVYMKWVEGAKEGQEIIYVKGENNGKALAHPGFGGFIGGMLNLILPTFAITPDGPTAMNGNRRPITDAGIGMMIEKIIHYNSAAKANGDLKLSFKGEAEVDGRPALVVERILPHKEGYPAHRTTYYIDKGYNLPVIVVLYDWEDQMMAYYEYSSLVLNPGLKPIDFETRNKEYRFGLVPPIVRD